MPARDWENAVLEVHTFQHLTDIYQSLANSISSNPLITGKNQLYGTALPCWIRLTHPSHLPASQASLSAPPIQICPFYIKHSREWFLFIGIRQPPAFPCRLQHSIIGRLGLNHRVRDGNGCVPQAHHHRNPFSVFKVLPASRLTRSLLSSFPLLSPWKLNSI